jgi:hypothetical protein
MTYSAFPVVIPAFLAGSPSSFLQSNYNTFHIGSPSSFLQSNYRYNNRDQNYNIKEAF